MPLAVQRLESADVPDLTFWSFQVFPLNFTEKRQFYGKKTIFPLQTKKRERTERCDAQFKLNSNFFVPV